MIEKERKFLSPVCFIMFSKDYVIEEKEQCLNSDVTGQNGRRDISFNKAHHDRKERERERALHLYDYAANAIIAVDRSSKNNIKRDTEIQSSTGLK